MGCSVYSLSFHPQVHLVLSVFPHNMAMRTLGSWPYRSHSLLTAELVPGFLVDVIRLGAWSDSSLNATSSWIPPKSGEASLLRAPLSSTAGPSFLLCLPPDCTLAPCLQGPGAHASWLVPSQAQCPAHSGASEGMQDGQTSHPEPRGLSHPSAASALGFQSSIWTCPSQRWGRVGRGTSRRPH